MSYHEIYSAFTTDTLMQTAPLPRVVTTYNVRGRLPLAPPNAGWPVITDWEAENYGACFQWAYGKSLDALAAEMASVESRYPGITWELGFRDTYSVIR